jgi:plasmid stabilization system protein ParE
MNLAIRTAAANEDLRGIAFQIGVESGRPFVAEKIIDELIDCCERLAALASMAQMGTLASRLGAGIRLFTHKRWVIVFRYVDEGVLILRIADGSQDYLSWEVD